MFVDVRYTVIVLILNAYWRVLLVTSLVLTVSRLRWVQMHQRGVRSPS